MRCKDKQIIRKSGNNCHFFIKTLPKRREILGTTTKQGVKDLENWRKVSNFAPRKKSILLKTQGLHLYATITLLFNHFLFTGNDLTLHSKSVARFISRLLFHKTKNHTSAMKKSIYDMLSRKGSLPISMLTAYDYHTARAIDEAGIDMILVGDSLGNVILGYENTLSVTIDDMIHHGKAVCRGAKNAFVVIDMPFMSYQTSVEDAVTNAGRILKETNCQAVKLEGGQEYADRIKAITQAGIPVVAHIGLTPQSFNMLGGYKVQGKNQTAAQKLMDDARAVTEAGAFAITLECVPAALAKKVTESVSALTIGIGAGNGCDGQVLVYQDMLGYSDGFTPKFVKQYANLHEIMTEAFRHYKKDVETRTFPSQEHTFTISEDVLDKLY